MFVFSGNFGRDVVEDFEIGGTSDRIDLSELTEIADYSVLISHHVLDMGDHVAILDAMGNSVTLNDVRLSDLSPVILNFDIMV